jgi:hypothetical protein
MPKSKSRKKKSPKRVLALPDLEQAKTAVLNSLTSASGQRTYEHAIREFVAWYCSEPRLAFNRTVVLRYRIHLEQRRTIFGARVRDCAIWPAANSTRSSFSSGTSRSRRPSAIWDASRNCAVPSTIGSGSSQMQWFESFDDGGCAGTSALCDISRVIPGWPTLPSVECPFPEPNARALL